MYSIPNDIFSLVFYRFAIFNDFPTCFRCYGVEFAPAKGTNLNFAVARNWIHAAKAIETLGFESLLRLQTHLMNSAEKTIHQEQELKKHTFSIMSRKS